MNSLGIYQGSMEKILEVFSSFPEIEKVLVFGSRAKGTARKGSDIDLAIMGKKIKSDTALKVAAVLNEEIDIPYSCDVVAPLFLKNEALIDHINRVGKIIFNK